jgi:glutaredoxin
MQKYIMLTQDNCKYCTAALGLLESLGHKVEVYDVQDENMSLVVNMLRVTNTVPQLYAPDGQFIGGYTELKEYLNDSST